jgi:hypothetical protein
MQLIHAMKRETEAPVTAINDDGIKIKVQDSRQNTGPNRDTNKSEYLRSKATD